jgi:predicted O-linked N-acetylglucosamine transferase (SPINDLY family)
MADDAFATWLARGRAHQQEGRPADAIPCYRRAARIAPQSPVPPFHLGEVLWQLGLAYDALNAWRAATRLDPAFLPSRLALAEAALAQGDFATARDASSEAVALAPADARAHATLVATRAATGDAGALAESAAIFAANPALADSLPLPLFAALAEKGAVIADSIAARRFTPEDGEALRKLAYALHSKSPEVAARLAAAYSALSATLPAPAVPLLWPARTAGQTLRVAWLAPAPDSPSWERARDALRAIAPGISLLVLCVADPDRTRSQLDDVVPKDTLYLALASPADAGAAKAIAARDCDVLVDAAGLAVAVAAMLRARPARITWALDTGVPMHREPLVDRSFASVGELRDALRDLQSQTVKVEATASTADDLAHAWDAAVRAHQEGDLEQAMAGYADVLAQQPAFAPALHLTGVLAVTRNDPAGAAVAFAQALSANPGFVEARAAAVDLALAQRDFERALTLVQEGLARVPHDAALLRILGRVHLRRRDGAAAELAFRQLLMLAPANADAHFDHGVALQQLGDAQAAARAYQRALTFRPEMIAADFNLGVLFQQQGNRQAAVAAYSHVLSVDPAHVAAYKHKGDVLLAAGDIDAWRENFHAFEKHCPKALPLAVYALEACQHEADFERLEHYLDGLRREDFQAQDEEELADCLESLLYLLLFFDIEPSLLLRFAQAYDAVALRVYGSPLPAAPQRRPGPLRIGYLSGDLRNHVMGKMMWQAIAHHDRTQFQLYFYSNSRDSDEWTQRFEGVAARFVPVAALDDDAAAADIRGDDLDLLVDLSTHTQGSRPGILARKPARVQLTHVASAGTVGLSQIAYKLTDRYADVPENQEFQIERLLAMEGCVFPFRHVAPATRHPFHRAALGIAEDTVVIGAFVSPLKLSRRCLRLWREVLARIPRARLAFSPANPSMRASYIRLAKAAGIAEERIFFLPQGRDDAENHARYALVDLVLDTMPFGGVNGTIEALDMGVPVVTLVGKRHGERTSYSILANLGVTATIAQTGPEYIDIAVRLADDAGFRASVRAAIAAGIAQSPLTDMQGYARHLEAAYRAAIGGTP